MSKIQSLPRDGTTLIKTSELDFFLVFDRKSNEVCWTELHKGTISKRAIKLSNIEPIMQIVSVHNVTVGQRCLLIVVAKLCLSEKEDDPSGGYFDHYQKPYHMYIYSIEVEEEVIVDGDSGGTVLSQDLRLMPLQTFPTDYRPLSISLDYYTSIPFLFINGSNNGLHAYEIDMQTLKLHRGSHRDALRMHWEARLRFNRDKGANASSNISMPLCLLIERASSSSSSSLSTHVTNPASIKEEVLVGLETTAVLGYSSGLLSWTSNSRTGQTSGQPFGRVLLMDSPIMCLAALSRFKAETDDDEGSEEHDDITSGSTAGGAILGRGSRTTHVVVGLAEGAAILSLESIKVEPVMLPSIHSHGFVKAIAVGDITGDGYEDFILGFEDGTVISYAREVSMEEQETTEGREAVGGRDERKEVHGSAGEKKKENERLTGDRGKEGEYQQDAEDRREGHSAAQAGEREHDADADPSMDLARGVLDSSFELYGMGEGDEDAEEEDEDEVDGKEEETEEMPQVSESPSPEMKPLGPVVKEVWRPSHRKLAFRELWRTWLPFPIRGLAFSNHLQIPFIKAPDPHMPDSQQEQARIRDSRKGPKNLSVVTTKTLHCFALKSGIQVL